MPLLIAAFLLGAVAPPPPDDDDAPRTATAVSSSKNGDDKPAVAEPQSGSSGERDDEDKPRVRRASPDVHDAGNDDEEGKGQAQSSVVVTARRLDSARTQIDVGLGASVYSLTNETIENRPGGETGSVSDILSQAPGVTQSGARLMVRGSPANQVRINDVIIPETVSDPADLISSRMAQRTRLMSGTLPAQFGFAPAGVISITTKNGVYQHGGQAELFAATDGMVEPALEWAGSIGSTSLFMSGEVEHDHARIADAAGIGARDGRLRVDGLGFADHVINQENRVSLIFGAAHERHKFGMTSLGPGIETSQDTYGVATYQHSDDDFTVQASLFGGSGSDEARFTQRSRERRSSWGTQIDASDTVGPAHTMRWGLLVTRSAAGELGFGQDRSWAHRTAAAFYAQDEWKLAPSLTLNPGMRVEWLRGLHSRHELEPRASLVWQSERGLTAHVGYARYASAPPLAESKSSTRLANERDDYFDAGIEQKLNSVTLGIDAYRRSAQNYISEHQTIGSAVPTAFAFKRARISGVELSGTYAHRGTTAWVNFSLSRGRGRTLVGSGPWFAPALSAAWSRKDVPLASDRPVTATAGITQRTGAFSIGADVIVSSGAVRTLSDMEGEAHRRSPYALLGLAAVYHARIAGHAADLRLDFTNITNARYEISDAANPEGGWTRQGRARAITFGIEEGF